MYLTENLIDLRGRRFPMVGIYPFATKMLPRFRALGYREVKTVPGSFLPSGMQARGHEFHYSALDGNVKNDSRIKKIYRTFPRAEKEGFLYKNCLASYIHLHFGSNPAIASRFVEACR